MTVRVLALVFPQLPLEVVLRAAPDLARSGRPVGLVEPRGGALHVAGASRAALALGVVVGSTYAHALAVAPDLAVRERRPEEEAEALRAIARWATLVLSPRAAIEEARRAVLVCVSGTEHVHGPEERLLARATRDLRGIGYEVRGAIADTPLAALALAEHGDPNSCIAPAGRTLEALLPLPPRALALDAVALERLASVGIGTIEQLLALPRATLPSRLGEAVLERLDRALGLRPDVLAPACFPEAVRERFELEGGTGSPEALALALEDLAGRALARLAACSLAARAIEIVFAHEDGPASRFEVKLAAPVSQPRALLSVLRERLEKVDLGRPVESVALLVPETARVEPRQGDLFSARDTGTAEDLACLLARLEGRLGARSVARVELVADHRPERAFGWHPASEPAAAPGPAALAPGKRPVRLLARPSPLEVATNERGEPARFAGRSAHAVLQAVGPERIETGFWDGREVRRDYWVVADEAWRESWIFRDLDSGRWFLHGTFD